MLMRFIQFAFILTVITAFTALFSLIFIMTQGGPGFATTTLEFFVFEKGFNTVCSDSPRPSALSCSLIVFGIWLAQYPDLPQQDGLRKIDEPVSDAA